MYLEDAGWITRREVAHTIDDLDLAQETVRLNLGIAMPPTGTLCNEMLPITVPKTKPLTMTMNADYPFRRLVLTHVQLLRTGTRVGASLLANPGLDLSIDAGFASKLAPTGYPITYRLVRKP